MVSSSSQPTSALRPQLRAEFGDTLQENASLAGVTTARAGGPADALLVANSAAELERIARRLWEMEAPFRVLGYGSNVLVADSGLREVVVLNRARAIQIDAESEPPSVWAESGALIGTIARQAALKGLGGFEWAATVPGTLGGAVYGNAGAFGGDMNGSLLLAEILHPTGKEIWPVERMQYQYRSSALKRDRKPNVILSGRLKMERGDPRSVQEKMEAFSTHRRSTQPPGASMGSMFKNPPGDYAGRLIEAAGLKGARVSDAEISSVHANFFINHGRASAADIGELIRTAREKVYEKFGIQLDLEVELLGDWPNLLIQPLKANSE
ncbi:MAG: UDP-N-acetylmuramate dehydrogenase [Chloroflexi bacterium]|nr:MAG: UDP-N-acetylmuramate dehydrogenase [Chloroflexota bacterium]